MVFCVYVAARVIVQHQKTLPDDKTPMSSLEFLVSAMRALKRKHPLAGSFSAQLEVEIKQQGMLNPNIHSQFMASQNRCVRITAPTDILGLLSLTFS